MRVVSSLWVGAYVRRRNAAGTPTVVMRRGAEEAGAIFVIIDRLDGTADLYGPAPQAAFDDAAPQDRLFQRLLERADGASLHQRLESEKRFDPDVWVVAVEDRRGTALLDLAETG